jgi:arginase
MKLYFPEWQSYGEHNRVAVGARKVHNAFSDGFVSVEVSNDEALEIEDGVLGRSAIARNIKAAIASVKSVNPSKIFLVGGTCGSELVPISYLNERYNGDLAVVWFDAHGDLNTPESSPSGHFHGMVLRTLLGDGAPELTHFVSRFLMPNQITLAGVRNLDPGELEYVFKQEIPFFNPQQLASTEQLISAIQRSSPTYIYIHLDLDFFDPADFPNVLVPTNGGISVEAFLPILTEINTMFNIVGISIVEYVPGNITMIDRIKDLFERSGITIE